MRGDLIYQVYGLHEGREADVYLGAFQTYQEALSGIEKLKAWEMNGKNWAFQYHNQGFAIREVVVDTDFEIPSRPKPRDRYVVKTTPKPNRPGTWNSTLIEVYRRTAPDNLEQICTYERNYAMLHTFEPFRQGNREFALISRDYTRTAVLDLSSGEVIAEEPESDPPGSGFCPAGFYVPDWWDVNSADAVPGSHYWSRDNEWPNGEFGFVWGCHWGDDNSWKVQYLDLRQVSQGLIVREERFGYVELAAYGFESPSLMLERGDSEQSNPPRFIHVQNEGGVVSVTFAVEMTFDLSTGKPDVWQRLRIGKEE